MATLFHTLRSVGNPTLASFVLAVATILLFASSPAHAAIDVRFDKSARAVLSKDARAEIESIARASHAEAFPKLEGLASRIRLTVRMGDDVIPETGEGGAAVSRTQIRWTLDAKRPQDALSIARTSLRATMFHELHHLARGWTLEGNSAPIRILDAAVAEGLATQFAKEHSDAPMPWGDVPPHAEAWVKEIAALPPGAPYSEWMFWHPDGRRWVGYRAGTWIAARAIERTGQSAAALATTPTDEVVRLSGTLR